ncbi:MAG: YraN family protein [Bacteroidales bacterium]|nr:MAG: YraN family protein [Bacteroidales bacterium]
MDRKARMPLSRLYLQKVTLSATATGVRANEIDIVAEKDNRIIVVEVKSRSHPIYDISQVITRDKIRHLINAGNAYVKMFNLPHELQFDVILMVGQDPDNFTVEHIPDAFMAPLRTY